MLWLRFEVIDLQTIIPWDADTVQAVDAVLKWCK